MMIFFWCHNPKLAFTVLIISVTLMSKAKCMSACYTFIDVLAQGHLAGNFEHS